MAMGLATTATREDNPVFKAVNLVSNSNEMADGSYFLNSLQESRVTYMHSLPGRARR